MSITPIINYSIIKFIIKILGNINSLIAGYLPPVSGVCAGMSSNQRHPLLFWPSVSDQSEPHFRVSRKDSIRAINAFRGSEENLDKDFTPTKQYTYTESKSYSFSNFDTSWWNEWGGGGIPIQIKLIL